MHRPSAAIPDLRLLAQSGGSSSSGGGGKMPKDLTPSLRVNPRTLDHASEHLSEKELMPKQHEGKAAGSKRRQLATDYTGDARSKKYAPKSGELPQALRGHIFTVSTDFDKARGKTGHFKLAQNTLVERIGKAKGLVQVRCFHDARIQGLVPKEILSELPASAFKKQVSTAPAHSPIEHPQRSAAHPEDSVRMPLKPNAVGENSEKPLAGKSIHDSSETPAESKQEAKDEPQQILEEAFGAGSDVAETSKLTIAERAQARQRYREKLQAFASARGADGTNGKPAKSRSELMAARKAKEDRRAARKKEERGKAKGEDRGSAESEASRLIGGFGMAGLAGPGAANTTESFTFNHMDTDVPRAKGKKRDAKTALAVAEKRERRIAAYDEEKRALVQDKNAWSAAQRRIAGEKSKDNTALLRRTIKRREKAKKKSADAWKKRLDGVQAGMKARQQRRTENLKKRRPGFEGTFKLAKRHV